MPTDEALEQLLALAVSNFREDRYAISLELYSLYLQHRPDDVRSRLLFGECLRLLGLNEEAKEEFLKVLDAELGNAGWKIHARLGTLYAEWGKHEAAEQHWQQACFTNGAPGWLWIMRGSNFARWGRFVEAIDCHRKATALDDCDRDEAFLNLGLVLRAQGKYEEAENAFRSALEFTPNYKDAVAALQSLEGLSQVLNEAKALLE